MSVGCAISNECGTASVDFAVTAPFFIVLLAGVLGAGMLTWAQIGLQHGVQMAARCASVNVSLCNTVTATQTYAANQAVGLNPSPSVFSVSSLPCGTQVSASYPVTDIATLWGMPALALTAQYCFPK